MLAKHLTPSNERMARFGGMPTFGEFFKDKTAMSFKSSMPKMNMPAMSMPKFNFSWNQNQTRPASRPMQMQWQGFSFPNKIIKRTTLPDTDRDGVPNMWDCQPTNPGKQDTQIYLKPRPHHLSKLNISNTEFSSELAKQFSKGKIAFTIGGSKTSVFLGDRLKNINPDNNIPFISNIIAHEEMHNALSKHVGEYESNTFDNIAEPVIFEDEHTTQNINPGYGQINPSKVKKYRHINELEGQERKDAFDEYTKQMAFGQFKPQMGEPLDYTAARRFGTKNIQRLPKLGQGRDRVVYQLDKDKVLKVAKNVGGLNQNIYERDLDYLGQIKHHETGKDYVVMEKVDKPGKATTAFLRPFKKLSPDDYTKHSGAYQDALEKADMSDFLSFSIAGGDFSRKRNWGEKEGKPVLIDAGTLNVDSLKKFRLKDADDFDRKEWNEIQQQRKIYRNKGAVYPERYRHSPDESVLQYLPEKTQYPVGIDIGVSDYGRWLKEKDENAPLAKQSQPFPRPQIIKTITPHPISRSGMSQIKHMLSERAKEKDMDEQLFDVEAEYDSNLTPAENKRIIGEKIDALYGKSEPKGTRFQEGLAVRPAEQEKAEETLVKENIAAQQSYLSTQPGYNVYNLYKTTPADQYANLEDIDIIPEKEQTEKEHKAELESYKAEHEREYVDLATLDKATKEYMNQEKAVVNTNSVSDATNK